MVNNNNHIKLFEICTFCGHRYAAIYLTFYVQNKLFTGLSKQLVIICDKVFVYARLNFRTEKSSSLVRMISKMVAIGLA